MKHFDMEDPYGREISNIRISITQECDLKCFYCHQEGEDGEGGQLSLEDVTAIVKTASGMGMNKIKFSGGEPLVHPDIVEMVSVADRYMDDVSLTSNGTMMKKMAEDLRSAGLDRANMSLDTLDRGTYEQITGRDKLDDAVEGIKEAVDVGLFPVKLNTLLMKGINDDEIEDLIEFSAEVGTILQLIEMTSTEEGITDDFYRRNHLPLEDIADELEERALEIREREMHARRKYFLDEPKTQVELVRTMHNSEFCANCTRLRVTSEGELKPCLLRTNNHVDIRKELNTDKDLKEKFIEAIDNREPYWSE